MNLSAKRFVQTGEYQVFFRGIYWQQQADTGSNNVYSERRKWFGRAACNHVCVTVTVTVRQTKRVSGYSRKEQNTRN